MRPGWSGTTCLRSRMLRPIRSIIGSTGSSDVPLFLYGVPNRDKARLTTIMLAYFHRQKLDFESIIVFENQADIHRTDLARLSDVGVRNDLIARIDQ